MKSNNQINIEQNLIFIEKQIKDEHCFVFKGRKFPFDSRLLSEYFQQHQELKDKKEIQLKKPYIDGIIDFKDEIIIGFIKFVQKERPLSLNDDNVIALNYLGNEYQINNLIEPTRKYISNNIDKFIVQLIQIHQSDPDISAANYEEILSQNLPKFITNKQLISFDIPCLYRILEKYHKEYSSNNNNQMNLDDYFNFLFGCLDKHGKPASILFTFINFERVPIKHIDHLIKHYSNVFDFQFINILFVQQLVKFKINEEKNLERNKHFTLIIIIIISVLLFLVSLLFCEIFLLKEEHKLITNNINLLSNTTYFLQKQLDKAESDNEETIKTALTLQKGNITTLQLENNELKVQLKQQEQKLIEAEKSLRKYKEEHEPKVVGRITARVESNQIITGQIEITEKGGILDKNRSKFIINDNSSPVLGFTAYDDGIQIGSLNQKFTFVKPSGIFFVHAIITDNFGNMNEVVSSPIVSKLKEISFSFTGCVQSVILGAGSYKLEVWGASGGENEVSGFAGSPGMGGYSVGTLTLKSETTLYVYVGGCTSSGKGGWNGGGEEGMNGGASGGGSTDISLFGEDGSDKWYNDEHIYSRIIVAGGGGGSASSSRPDLFGGYGGGEIGGPSGFSKIKGGTQTGGLHFGVGGFSVFASGGGGGWYGSYTYNGNSIGVYPGGSGGSGYVFNSMTAKFYPRGCRLNSSFFLSNSSTISGNTEFPDTTGRGKEVGHSGNGHAKITPL